MNHQEKNVTYTTQNSYETLNELTSNTKNVWIVFHGIGYLSKYFLKYFNQLNVHENYLIAPQAPSKYYLKDEYKYVGASWLTKENTSVEIKNVLNYLDAVFEAEKLPQNINLNIFGYSQGVSIATRWVVKQKLKCKHLILHSGAVPRELKTSDFEFLKENQTQITFLVGDNDEFINEERLKIESARIEDLFEGRANQIVFQGKHEIKKELLNQFQ